MSYHIVMRRGRAILLGGAVACAPALAAAQEGNMRDSFSWIGEINKASAVINSDEGLLDAAGYQQVVDAG